MKNRKLFIGGVESGSQKFEILVDFEYPGGHWCRRSIASAVVVLSKSTTRKTFQLLDSSGLWKWVYVVYVCGGGGWLDGIVRWMKCMVEVIWVNGLGGCGRWDEVGCVVGIRVNYGRN